MADTNSDAKIKAKTKNQLTSKNINIPFVVKPFLSHVGSKTLTLTEGSMPARQHNFLEGDKAATELPRVTPTLTPSRFPLEENN